MIANEPPCKYRNAPPKQLNLCEFRNYGAKEGEEVHVFVYGLIAKLRQTSL